MNTLKPCPFCGMNYAENAWDDYGSEYWVCEFCGAASGTERDEYIWNTRPIEDDLRNRIAELEEKQRWIPVSERLPEGGETAFVIIYDGYENVSEVARLTYLGDGNWWSWESERYVVTYWTPLPELPKERE